MALIQANAANRPVFKLDGDEFEVEFNVFDDPQYLVAPIPSSLPESAEFTFSGWFKSKGSFREFDDNPTLFGIVTDGGSVTDGAGLSYARSMEGLRMTCIGDSDGARETDMSLFPSNIWFHLAGCHSPGSTRLVLNGSTVASRTETRPMPADLSGYSVVVGAARDGARPVPICASNLQIWNISLTDQQVEDWAMKRLTGPLPSGLIFYAPM